MNLGNEEKWVWQTITYEFLDGAQPDYKNGKTVWMTIGTTSNPGLTFCTYFGNNPFGVTNLTSDALPKAIKFSEHSKMWTSKIDGYIIRAGGHMHEGGTSTEIFLNDKMVCDSLANYSKDAQSAMAGSDGHTDGMSGSAGSKPSGGHSHGRRQIKAPTTYNNTDIEHIANQTMCIYQGGLPLKAGDTMFVRANYDFNVHPGMKNKEGLLDQVMGIVGVMVAY